jgi:hypothetical protein
MPDCSQPYFQPYIGGSGWITKRHAHSMDQTAKPCEDI